jgi:hypothetical protein
MDSVNVPVVLRLKLEARKMPVKYAAVLENDD